MNVVVIEDRVAKELDLPSPADAYIEAMKTKGKRIVKEEIDLQTTEWDDD